MNYLSLIDGDEIKYVCSVIPLKQSIWYFRQHPKDFAKIMPGFRPTSLKSQEQVGMILFKNRNNRFVSSFIEKTISRWLDQIQDEIDPLIAKGESIESVWVKILPHCFFVDNINIYFKLINEEHSKEYILLLEQSIKHIKELDDSREKLEAALNDQEAENTRLKDKLERTKIDLDNSRKHFSERISEIAELKKKNTILEKLDGIIHSNQQELATLRSHVKERDDIINNLKNELITVKNEQQQIEEKIEKSTRLLEKASYTSPKRPRDINEFRDYLGYNFESIGIEPNADYYSLLKDYLCYCFNNSLIKSKIM